MIPDNRRPVLVAVAIVLASLFVGVLGYHFTERLPWIDALLSASMILGGMGPVGEIHHWQGKLFASIYALYSCFLVIILISVLMAPVMHRALHKFHAEQEKKSK